MRALGAHIAGSVAWLARLGLPCIGSRPASVGACLATVVWACLLPAGAAAAFALYSAYETMHDTLVHQAQTSSRSMARSVDGVISGAGGHLEALATSEALASNDIARFEETARRIQRYQPGDNLVLTAASGQQLVNTALPRGAPLPMHGNRDFQQAVLRSGRLQVSDLFLGGALKKPLIAIEVPVREGSAVPYTLAIGFLPDRFARLLSEQRPDPDWVVSILDSTGTIVARTHEADRFVGHKAAAGLLEAMRAHPDGMLETTTLEGTPVTNQRSSGRCWLFASTNVFRVGLIKKYKLSGFELSQAYLFFWDKLEKANWFLEQIIDTADQDLDSRLIQELLGAPVNDGGQWDMAANLVTKYGLV